LNIRKKKKKKKKMNNNNKAKTKPIELYELAGKKQPQWAALLYIFVASKRYKS
jgi:hypothetical protein